MKITELETNRIRLRQWKVEDYLPFSELNLDAKVMEFFPNTLTKTESDAMADKITSLISKRGWGFWAAEQKATHEFMGFVGLHSPNSELPFSPCVETGWRLAKKFWGFGYATEAAKQALNFAFEALHLDEVVSFTAVENKKSQAVMQRLGMINTKQNFMHPDIKINKPLCEHVLYKIKREQWVNNTLEQTYQI